MTKDYNTDSENLARGLTCSVLGSRIRGMKEKHRGSEVVTSANITNSLLELRENVRILVERVGSFDLVAEAMEISSKELREVLKIPIVYNFSGLKSTLTGEPLTPEDIFVDEGDSASVEKQVFELDKKRIIEEVLNS